MSESVPDAQAFIAGIRFLAHLLSVLVQFYLLSLITIGDVADSGKSDCTDVQIAAPTLPPR